MIGTDESAPFFDRAAHFNNLSDESVEQLRTEAERLFQRALESLNKMALAAQKRDSREPVNDRRLSMGAYVFTRKKMRQTEPNVQDDSLKD